MKAMNGWMIAGGVIQFENFRLKMMISNTYRVIVSN
jgi:hypothetical protein